MTNLSPTDRRLLERLANGLPLTPRPFSDIAAELEIEEDAVLARIRDLLEHGAIKRLGVVVRHHELGWTANAMTVWDIPDRRVDDIGASIGAYPFVTLCYRRPRRPPAWPYNLFAMIHGRDRVVVTGQIRQLVEELGLGDVRRDVLFSRRRFKQRGARYASTIVSERSERMVV